MSRRFKCIWSDRAQEDLIDIWTSIAADSIAAADRVVDEVKAAGQRLSDHPQLGPQRNDIRPGLRHLVVGRRLILCRIEQRTVLIVRVVHGSQDLFNLR